MSAPLSHLLHSADVEAIASTLHIKQHVGGHTAPWVVNEEQRKYWQTRDFTGWTFVAKPRQIGLSTAVCLEDVLWTQAADALGHVVKCAIVVDTFDHAKERINCCASFAQQLGFVAEGDCTEREIRFANGSVIVALTAGGANVGRSIDAQRLHLTELPNWPDPAGNYNDLTQALSLGCDVVIETTINNADPFTQFLWDTKNEYTKIFFGIEEHSEYVAVEDPGTDAARDEIKAAGLTVHSISDDRWLELQDKDPITGEVRGFKSRAAAAWFDWAIVNKCAGDEIKARHEYPQKVSDMFTTSKGRWIRVDTVVEMPGLCIPTEGEAHRRVRAGRHWPRVMKIPGVAGEQWNVFVWRELTETSTQLAAWVDTSEGKELSHSAIAIIDKKDSNLVATFNDGSVLGDDVARVLLTILDAFTDRREVLGMPLPERRPRCRIEAQGVNQTTVQQAKRLGIVFEEYTMTEERRNDQLLEAKRAIESGVINFGPPRLAFECRNLERDELGRWKGPKDLLMCIGGALVMRREEPFKDETARPLVDDKTRHVSARRLRAERRRGRGTYG